MSLLLLRLVAHNIMPNRIIFIAQKQYTTNRLQNLAFTNLMSAK